MADFRARLPEDLKTAMRAQDALTRETIRMLNSALKYAQIAAMHELSAAEAETVLVAQIKQRRDSVDQFRQAGREDLAAKEEAELGVLAAYLPPALAEEEIVGAVQAAIAELGAGSPKDMAPVMRAVLDRYPGRVDGKALAPLVQRALSGKA